MDRRTEAEEAFLAELDSLEQEPRTEPAMQATLERARKETDAAGRRYAVTLAALSFVFLGLAALVDLLTCWEGGVSPSVLFLVAIPLVYGVAGAWSLRRARAALAQGRPPAPDARDVPPWLVPVVAVLALVVLLGVVPWLSRTVGGCW